MEKKRCCAAPRENADALAGRSEARMLSRVGLIPTLAVIRRALRKSFSLTPRPNTVPPRPKFPAVEVETAARTRSFEETSRRFENAPPPCRGGCPRAHSPRPSPQNDRGSHPTTDESNPPGRSAASLPSQNRIRNRG